MIARATTLLPKSALFGTLAWLIVASTTLTMLAAAAALGLAGVGGAVWAASARAAMVQIVDADSARRDAASQHALRLLATSRDVRSSHLIGRDEMTRLLAPYLGEMRLADLPTPAMIELTLAPNAERSRVAQILSAIPSARLMTAGEASAPLAQLLTSLRTAAILGGVVAVAATALVALLAARAALAAHADTIAILHSLGTTDRQLARMMAERTMPETIGGAGIGFLIGAATIAFLAGQLGAIGTGLGSAALLGWRQWLMLLVVPPLIALIVAATVRLTTLALLRTDP